MTATQKTPHTAGTVHGASTTNHPNRTAVVATAQAVLPALVPPTSEKRPAQIVMQLAKDAPRQHLLMDVYSQDGKLHIAADTIEILYSQTHNEWKTEVRFWRGMDRYQYNVYGEAQGVKLIERYFSNLQITEATDWWIGDQMCQDWLDAALDGAAW